MRLRLPLLRDTVPAGPGRARVRVPAARDLHPARESRDLRVPVDRDRLPIAARVRVRAPEDPVLVPEVRGRPPVREELRRAPAPRDPAPAARVMKPEGREASENSFMFNSGEKP